MPTNETKNTNGLVLDLDNDTFEVTGDNEAFEDTAWEGKKFKIFVKPVTAGQIARITRKYTKIKKRVETTEYEKVNKELFMLQVVDWTGLYDGKGKEISYSEETKEKIAEKIYLFANLINSATLNIQQETNLKQEQEVKN